MSPTTLGTTGAAPGTGAATPRVAATAALASAGPLAIAVLRGILSYDTVDEPATVVEKIQAAPAAASAVQWLILLALITLPFGLAVVGGLALRARPVLGTSRRRSRGSGSCPCSRSPGSTSSRRRSPRTPPRASPCGHRGPGPAAAVRIGTVVRAGPFPDGVGSTIPDGGSRPRR